MRGMVDLPGRAARVHPRGAPLWIDPHAAHGRQVDHQPVVDAGKPGPIVRAAPDRDGQSISSTLFKPATSMYQVRRYKPESPQITFDNPELFRIGLASAAPHPGIGGDQESIARYVKYIVPDPQPVPPYFIELWIDELPTFFRRVPVFGVPRGPRRCLD